MAMGNLAGTVLIASCLVADPREVLTYAGTDSKLILSLMLSIPVHLYFASFLAIIVALVGCALSRIITFRMLFCDCQSLPLT